MTMTDTAAHASLGAAARQPPPPPLRAHPLPRPAAAAPPASGAAARELHLPTIRAEAPRLAEIAVRERQSFLCFLAEALAAEVDERASRRRSRRITEARFPR